MNTGHAFGFADIPVGRQWLLGAQRGEVCREAFHVRCLQLCDFVTVGGCPCDSHRKIIRMVSSFWGSLFTAHFLRSRSALVKDSVAVDVKLLCCFRIGKLRCNALMSGDFFCCLFYLLRQKGTRIMGGRKKERTCYSSVPTLGDSNDATFRGTYDVRILLPQMRFLRNVWVCSSNMTHNHTRTYSTVSSFVDFSSTETKMKIIPILRLGHKNRLP